MVSADRSISVTTGTFLSSGPLSKAALLAAASSFLVILASNNETMNGNAIYSGVFDLASIFAGFLATFYVFVVTKGNEFLVKIRTTKTFGMVLRLLKFTVLWSTFVIAFSYVMMVVDPTKIGVFSIMHAVVFAWLCNVFMVAVNFTRCVAQFLIIAEADK